MADVRSRSRTNSNSRILIEGWLDLLSKWTIGRVQKRYFIVRENFDISYGNDPDDDSGKTIERSIVTSVEPFTAVKGALRHGVNLVTPGRTFTLYCAEGREQQDQWAGALREWLWGDLEAGRTRRSEAGGPMTEMVDVSISGISRQGIAGEIEATDSSKNPPWTVNLDTSKFPENREDFTFDFCLSYAIGEDEKTKLKNEKIIYEELSALQTAGLKLTFYRSVQGDELYVLLGATEARLIAEAHRTEYELSLHAMNALQVSAQRGIKLALKTKERMESGGSPETSRLSFDQWVDLFGKYAQHAPQSIYMHYDLEPAHPNSLFTPVERLKLTVSIVEADQEVCGAGLAFTYRLQKASHPLLAWFPLHSSQQLKSLKQIWNPRKMFHPPCDSVRYYFGEKVALYFAFLGYYNRALVFPAILGIIFFIMQLLDDEVAPTGIWVLGFSIAIWGTFFLEIWKRKEARLRTHWGMSNFHFTEQPRPEFDGDLVRDETSGEIIKYFSPIRRILRMMFSSSVILTLIACVIAAVAGIFVLKNRTDDGTALIGISIFNAVQIQILNFVYGKVSVWLNSLENYRTDTEFENALITKSFIFKFVNSYNSLFYIAFVKQSYGSKTGCVDPFGDKTGAAACLSELRLQLAIIFGAQIVSGNLIEYFVPYLSSRWARYQETKGTSAKKENLTQGEKESLKAPIESTFDDYDELIVQFGYVSLFIIAFPLTPLLALANNFVETWLDSRKYTRLSRRPEPRGAVDIGTWKDILDILTVISVGTNVGLIVISIETFDSSSIDNIWIFVICEHALLALKFALQYFIPDVPLFINRHLTRQEHIVETLIEGADDIEDDEVNKLGSPKNSAMRFATSEVAIGLKGKPQECNLLLDNHDHND
eukprot:191043_1